MANQKTDSDEKQEREQQVLADFRRVLETDYGRRTIWHLLELGNFFESIWDSSARIHYNAGMQDYARSIFRLVAKVKPDALTLMANESQRIELDRQKSKKDKS